jgi:hypothetical protein
MWVEGVVSGSQRGYEEQDKRCERKLDDHVQTRREQREGKDVLRLTIALFFLEHPFVVDGYGDGEEVPVLVSHRM